MTREAQLQLLKTKLDYWLSPGKIADFYGNLATDPVRSQFVTERDNDGYFWISENIISYYNLRNGFSFRMRKDWLPQDWSCYTQLYNRSKDVTTFRVDEPLYREVVEYAGHSWEYAEVQRPDSSHGNNFSDEVFSWDTVTINPEHYFRDFIDQCAAIDKECISIANDSMCGVPSNICIMTNHYRGPLGYSWSDGNLLSWNGLGVSITGNAMIYLRGALNFVTNRGFITVDTAKDLLNYAEAQWKAI